MASAMRSTSGSSSARLVITALVCGSRSSRVNVAPPLKSMSAKFSEFGGWVTASASTSVRSSSLLPEPVAPMSSPCGPMPSCADSLRSSSIGVPSGRMPNRTRSRSRFGRGTQVSCGSNAYGSPRSSSSARPSSELSGCSPRAPSVEPQRRELAGERLGGRRRQRVGAAERRSRRRRCRWSSVPSLGHVQHDRGPVRRARRRGRQVDDRDALDAVAGHQVVGAGGLAAVEHHHEMRARRPA